MTVSRVWLWLRWPLALLGLLLIVRYAAPRLLETLPEMVAFDADAGSIFGAGGTEPEATPTATAAAAPAPSVSATPTLAEQTGSVVEGSATPAADFAVDSGIVGILEEPELEIGDDEGDAVVLGFPLIAGDPTCVGTATFGISVIDSASTTLVGLYGSSQTNPAAVEQTQLLEDGVAPAEAQPAAESLLGDEGRLEIDVTGLYQEYATTQGLPADAQFAIAIQPIGTVEPQGGVTFASSEAEDADEAPTLSWTGDAACGTE